MTGRRRHRRQGVSARHPAATTPYSSVPVPASDFPVPDADVPVPASVVPLPASVVPVPDATVSIARVLVERRPLLNFVNSANIGCRPGKQKPCPRVVAWQGLRDRVKTPTRSGSSNTRVYRAAHANR